MYNDYISMKWGGINICSLSLNKINPYVICHNKRFIYLFLFILCAYQWIYFILYNLPLKFWIWKTWTNVTLYFIQIHNNIHYFNQTFINKLIWLETLYVDRFNIWIPIPITFNINEWISPKYLIIHPYVNMFIHV